MRDFILLDRDGVLNVDLPGAVTQLERLQLLPGAVDAVALLGAKGYGVLVVTNQACVGRGELSYATLESIHAHIDREVAAAGGRIDGWYVCAHRADAGCDCRKPRPGLILRASRTHCLDLSRTFFVGDAARDVEAALAAGCRPVLVRTGKGKVTAAAYPDVPCHDDLLAFAHALPAA